MKNENPVPGPIEFQRQPWPLSKLKDHPRQAAMFGDLVGAEFDALVADMERRGQQTPVEILPDGTIITGHQRVRAARRLGWKEITVVVRLDLARAGPAAVEQHFLMDNLHRRQLTPLARARCIERMATIEAGDKLWGLTGPRRETLKAEVAARLGISPRTVNCYLLILEAPPAVQAAFDRGELSLTVAGKVAMLDEKARAAVARRIEAGGAPGRVVAEYTEAGTNGGDVADQAFRRLVRALFREVPRLKGRAGEVKGRRLPPNLPHLRAGRAVIDELIDRAEGTAAAGPPGAG